MREGEEELIFTPKTQPVKDGPMVDFAPYVEMMKNHKVGELWRFGNGEMGYVDYVLTRMDEIGIYGRILRETMYSQVYEGIADVLMGDEGLRKAEKWRDALDEMAEVGNNPNEREAVRVLRKAVEEAILKLTERTKTKK